MSISYETYQPKTEWQADVLSYPLFQDDFGEPNDIIFRDRIVRVRSNHRCHHCGGWVLNGTLARYYVTKFDGMVRQYYFCFHCCAAMSVAFKDDHKAICDRFHLHAEKQ